MHPCLPPAILISLCVVGQLRADDSCPLASPEQLSVTGWLAQGFTWNPDSPRDRFNGFLSNNDRSNEYQLNQFYLALSQPPDTNSNEVTFGFTVDLIYGADAFLFQSLGWDDNTVSDADSRFYKLAIPQFYLEAFLPIGDGATLKFGKWYALVGFESGLAASDFFYSHTLGYNFTPYTHTGVLVEHSIGDNWSFQHGLHRGQDVFEDNNDNLGFTGSVTWTSTDEATTVAFAMVCGPEQDERVDFQDINGQPGPDAPGKNLYRFNYSIYAEHQFAESLRAVVVYNSFHQNGSSQFGLEDSEAYSLAGSIFHQTSNTCAIGARLEVARDDDAFTSSGFRSFNPTAPSLFTNLTLGLNLTPRDSIRIRPEIRWDWQHRDSPADPPAFDDATDSNQFTVACDVVLTF